MFSWIKNIFGNGRGCYDEFYKNGISYLGLLNLGDDDESIDSIKILNGLTKLPNWKKDSVSLLSNRNWRSHLAPAVSYLSTSKIHDDINDTIWRTATNESWVSPQLIATLWIKKFDFTDKLNPLLNDGINVGAATIERHVEMGPGGNESRLGKIVNSLIGLGFNHWGDISDERIQKIQSFDVDCGDVISKGWHDRILSLLKSAQQ